MFEKLKKKNRERKEGKTGTWVVFNSRSDLEFGECSCCGCEVEPRTVYPGKCPNCEAKMLSANRAEDLKGNVYGGYVKVDKVAEQK